MKSFVSKIASVFLAFLVLFSTMSFTVGIHYCGNILKGKSILAQAEPCDMHDVMPSKDKSDCCDDEVEIVKGQDLLHFSKAEFNLDVPLEFAIFSFIHFSSPYVFAKKTSSTEVYDPPEYVLDFQILHQVFRI